jgi:predicted NUDIX family NTP pyrophosphohydrolase
MEWPPRSGKVQRFPEVDRVGFFPVEEARRKINLAQTAFLDRLMEQLDSREAKEI